MDQIAIKPLDKDLAMLIVAGIERDGANPTISGYSESEIAHQMYAMWKAGLVNAADTTADTSAFREAIFLNFH